MLWQSDDSAFRWLSPETQEKLRARDAAYLSHRAELTFLYWIDQSLRSFRRPTLQDDAIAAFPNAYRARLMALDIARKKHGRKPARRGVRSRP